MHSDREMINKQNLNLASPEEAKTYFTKASTWLSTTVMWTDSKSCARTAVARAYENLTGLAWPY